MSSSFFDDWLPCEICGWDHQWDVEESLAAHTKLLFDQANRKPIKFKQDLQAYVSFGLSMLLICNNIFIISHLARIQ